MAARRAWCRNNLIEAMKTLLYLSPIVIALTVALGCSNNNGCLGTSSNNTVSCGQGTHPQLEPNGTKFWCVPG